MIRVEYQARGSRHAHKILWIKDAPKVGIDTDVDIANFIDRYQSCSIPDNDDELRTLVKTLQTHVHSRTSGKAQSCRFRFPHPPSDNTVIAKTPEGDDPVTVARDIKAKQETLRKVKLELENPDFPQTSHYMTYCKEPRLTCRSIMKH